jgi:hypothetical protein
VIEVSDLVADAVSKSQGQLIKSRKDLFEAEDRLRAAEHERTETERQKQQFQKEREKLQRDVWRSEVTIDTAQRLLAYIGAPMHTGTNRFSLAMRFENSDPRKISRDASGHFFYGALRLPSDEMETFLRFIDKHQPAMAARLREAGGPEAAKTGKDEFKAEWLSLTDDPTFLGLQTQWIEEQHFQPFVRRINADIRQQAKGTAPRFSIETRSVALMAVLWSVVLQHGRNTPVVRRAWTGLDNITATDDRTLICRIYAERRKLDQFKDEPEVTKNLLMARYQLEEREALHMLNSAQDTTNNSPAVEECTK